MERLNPPLFISHAQFGLLDWLALAAQVQVVQWPNLDLSRWVGGGNSGNMNFQLGSTAGPPIRYVLAGPTCDSIDVFSRDAAGEICTVELPEMHLDDLLIAGSMGAYTFSESARFNGFEPPKFVFID